MSCQEYDKYMRGELSEQEFHSHSVGCQECSASWEFERKLTAEISSFRSIRPSQTLWFKVRARLLRERERQEQSLRYRLNRLLWHLGKRPAWAIAVIAGMLLVVIAGLVQLQNRPSRLLLTDAAVERVEKKEREYEQAIAELENLVGSVIAQADADLMLLYREKLETLDSQIARCKEALELNPYNAHVRRYLLAAYQEKKETLKEVVSFISG